ncbi:MAG: CBS domain-containing protein [Gammaproteobacteria bacterium]|nr:MAG: CBS domain-containing protein [Gammaproteobacteria bacterium]
MISESIADCMNKDFAVIHPDMPVVEASGKLIQKDMLGGPVTDKDGLLVGWISEQECLQVAIQVVYHNQRVASVRDIMRTDVLTVTANEDPLSLAQQMLLDKPKSYPVVDKRGKVLGVITRRRILKMLDGKLAEMSVRS